MPGYLKVDGAQHPVVAPYVKVAGAWTPSALGYIKVDGEWKIWHSAKIEDDFNRVGAGDLGTASNGFSKWTRLSGNWGISGNQASHDSAALGIVSTQLYKATTDYKVSVDLPSNTGLGVAFWIQDADTWHAAIPGVRQQDNAGYYSCPSGFTLEGTNCRKTTVYPATYEADRVYDAPAVDIYAYECNYGGTVSGSKCVGTQSYPNDCTTVQGAPYCPNGGTLSGMTCTKTSSPTSSGGGSTYIGCEDASLCNRAGGSCSGSCSSGCKCYKSSPTVCKCGTTTVSCGATCTSTYTASRRASTISCPPCGPDEWAVGQECFYTTELYDADYVYQYTNDPAPVTITGRGWWCPNGGTNPGGSDTCTIVENQNASYTPPSTSYPSVIRIYKSLGGTITQEFTQDISSDPRSFEVVTSGNNVQVYLYSAVNLGGTRVGAVSHALSSPIKTTTVGLAKYGNQVQRQGTAIDNFKAE